MKYHHVQRSLKEPFYIYFKKHYCPKCNKVLEKIKVSKIVNSNSPEANDYDFHTVDNYMIGNIKFIWTEFKCMKCGMQFAIDEMKRIEKLKKNKSKKQ